MSGYQKFFTRNIPTTTVAVLSCSQTDWSFLHCFHIFSGGFNGFLVLLKCLLKKCHTSRWVITEMFREIHKCLKNLSLGCEHWWEHLLHLLTGQHSLECFPSLHTSTWQPVSPSRSPSTAMIKAKTHKQGSQGQFSYPRVTMLSFSHSVTLTEHQFTGSL